MDHDPTTSTSQVARVTGMHVHTQPLLVVDYSLLHRNALKPALYETTITDLISVLANTLSCEQVPCSEYSSIFIPHGLFSLSKSLFIVH
jgi:hypothetical protein